MFGVGRWGLWCLSAKGFAGRPVKVDVRSFICGPMIEDKNIICWNCRGASSGSFIWELKELLRPFRPTIIVLLEPKVSAVMVDGIFERIEMS